MTELLRGGRVVTSRGIVDPGWVEVSDDVITAVGGGYRNTGTDLRGALVTPGFVDGHVHGAVGATFGVNDTTASRKAALHHARNGTTAMLAGLRAATLDELEHRAGTLTSLLADTSVTGVFLEGPFLSKKHSGAQRADTFREPALQTVQTLVDDVGSVVPLRLITVAPELNGALDAIRLLRKAGVTVAIGHTDADYQQAADAFDAGATVVTHLFNAMRPLHHRDPGPVLAAIDDARVTTELIVDGHHVDYRVVALAFEKLGSGRIMLMTDAMEATGLVDGDYPRGDRTIRVVGGKATFTDTGGLAGSTLTLSDAVRNVVLGAGVGIVDAVRAATQTPARALGMSDQIGSLAPGMRADINIFDDSLQLVATMQRGAWLTGPWSRPTPPTK